MDLGDVLKPWTDVALEQVPDVEVFDAHTHIGQNDPDGMSQTLEQLVAGLELAGARGAFVFPMHEPEGYPNANDSVIADALSTNGLLIPFCRVNPNADPVPEAERCLAEGARGIKLHPRAEQFTLDHPEVRKLVALAHERTLPVLIHARRGIPALGLHAVELAEQFPNARLILAHAAISDLSWIWRVAPDLPNGATAFALAFQLRAAIQVGLSSQQIRSITSEQALRLAAGEPLQTVGPAVGERERAPHLLLDRVAEFLLLSAIATMRGGDPTETLALARLACDVPEEIDDAPVFAAIRELLDVFDAYSAEHPDDRRRLTMLVLAATAARTPEVPIPAAAGALIPGCAPRSA